MPDFKPAYMGEFLKEYQSPAISINKTINHFFAKPTRFHPTAFVTKEVMFPDVSFYQEEIDYEVMSTKTRAIILRAGQGTWVDDQFERNYSEAKRTGLLVGIYWFYDGRYSPGSQANLLISLLRNKKIEMEVFIDWEHNYGGSYEGLKNVVAMMQVVEAAGLDIKDIGIYTGYYFFRANSNIITNAGQYNYLRIKPLWEAWYTNDPLEVLIPAPWLDLTHWQFGTPAVYWGQKTREIDMNWFNGVKSEFNQRYGNGTTEPGETMSYKITPDFTIGSKIRKDHSASSTQISSLSYGKYGYGVERWGDGTVEDWIHITEYENNQGGRTVLDGWVASRNGGTKYATITVVAEPPPPPPPSTLPTLLIEVSDTEGLYTPVTVELKPK